MLLSEGILSLNDCLVTGAQDDQLIRDLPLAMEVLKAHDKRVRQFLAACSD